VVRPKREYLEAIELSILMSSRKLGFRRTEFSETQLIPLLILGNPICRGSLIRSGPGLHAETSAIRSSRKAAAMPSWSCFDLERTWEGDDQLGSARGSPNQGSTPVSKRVMALIWSPVRVRT
jgi:hypothetical protein